MKTLSNGDRMKFWHDTWCGEQPLKGASSDIFDIAWAKDASVTAFKCISLMDDRFKESDPRMRDEYV